MTALPLHPDDFDLGWLAETLGQPMGSLIGFTHKPIGTGQMADSYRLTLDWHNAAPDAPATIIAKCPSHSPESRAIAAALGSYALETNWYLRGAPTSQVACPPCTFAAQGESGEHFLLLLGDLAPARQGDQLAGASAAQITLAVDQAVALHAGNWGKGDDPSLAWLHRDSKPLVRQMLPAMHAGFADRYATRLSADVLALCAGLVERIEAYLAVTPSAPTIVHGDLRIDNILFAADDSAAHVVDWQTLGSGSGPYDLAYLIGTSTADPAERRAHDSALFARYCDGLTAQGIAIDADTLWREYRLGALSGVLMAIFASMSVERTARGDEMFAVMAERPALQALDLGSLALL